jgi:hypothetical protein
LVTCAQQKQQRRVYDVVSAVLDVAMGKRCDVGSQTDDATATTTAAAAVVTALATPSEPVGDQGAARKEAEAEARDLVLVLRALVEDEEGSSSGGGGGGGGGGLSLDGRSSERFSLAGDSQLSASRPINFCQLSTSRPVGHRQLGASQPASGNSLASLGTAGRVIEASQPRGGMNPDEDASARGQTSEEVRGLLAENDSLRRELRQSARQAAAAGRAAATLANAVVEESDIAGGASGCDDDPTSSTLHPTPYTLQPTTYNLHATP